MLVAEGSVLTEWDGVMRVPGIGPSWRRLRSFPIGVDYYPSDNERRAHAEYYPYDAGVDFAAMATAGVTLVRVFVSWKRFEPEVGQYDGSVEERLGDLLYAAGQCSLKVIVCFFADDRFSEMNDPPWARGRDPRTDDYLIHRQVSLVQRVASLHRTDPRIWAWQLGNEPFFAEFTSTASLQKWSLALRDALREVDSARAIILGTDSEVLSAVRGLSVSVGGFEYGVAHANEAYREQVAGVSVGSRATHLESFLVRAAPVSRPVLADGIGARIGELPAAGGAADVRVAAFSALMNGAAGVALARWRDAETAPREPWFSDPYEVLAGVNDSAGAPRPALGEIGRIARVVARLEAGRYALAPERAAVIVPAGPSDLERSPGALGRSQSCFNAYVAAKEAHIPVAVVSEGDDLAGFSAVFVPSAGALSEILWTELAALVRSGGSVVLSYGGGTPEPLFREVFGVDFRADAGERDTFSCRDGEQGLFPGLGSFDAALRVSNLGLVVPESASVAAVDASGIPLVTVNRYGRGSAIFLAVPLEQAIARGVSAADTEQARTMVRTLYRTAARESGANGFVACDEPAAEIALFIGEDDDALLVLNHGGMTITPVVTAGRVVASVADLSGARSARVGEQSFGVPLRPFGLAALRLDYA